MVPLKLVSLKSMQRTPYLSSALSLLTTLISSSMGNRKTHTYCMQTTHTNNLHCYELQVLLLPMFCDSNFL